VLKQYGFSYNPKLAKQFLKASSYKARTSLFRTGRLDGLEHSYPGHRPGPGCRRIKATAFFPEYAAREANLTDGTYDFALDTTRAELQPVSYFDRVFQLPILKKQTAQLNWERDNNPAPGRSSRSSARSVDERSGLSSHLRTTRADRAEHPAEIRSGTTGRGAVQHHVLEGLPGLDQCKDQYTPVMWAAGSAT